MPVFRARQQEIAVLKSFDFGENIFPCIEIVKELDRKSPPPRAKKGKSVKSPIVKSFEKVYLPLIQEIKAKRVFVDLPNHLDTVRGMNPDVILFLKTVVYLRKERTEYMKKLSSLANKVIPVLSTYSQITNEIGSITKQADDLRPLFKVLAFRTFPKTFSLDMPQIEKLVRRNDYVIIDFGNREVDMDDPDLQEIGEALRRIDCNIVIHRNAFPMDITLSKLSHNEVVDIIDNSILTKYRDFSGNCFSDFVGIKKDNKMGTGGISSPGFIFYDAVTNDFYGYRYKYGSHVKGETPPHPSEFETTIVPAVLSSEAAKRMKKNRLDFLGIENAGWKTILNISNKGESGQAPAKFKKIGMEHYLHCLKLKIANGDFS